MTAHVFQLLKHKTFLPLFLTQFFGAFNDNAFKFAMLTLISYHISVSETQSEKYQAMAGVLFILPFFIFSATAGQLADKIDKAKIIRIIKLFEIILALIGGLGFYFGKTWLLMLTLAGFGIHSTFFGPIKYSILPNHLPRSLILGATALIEASTFIAILLGTLSGTLTIGGIKTGSMVAIILILSVALAGFLSSLYIPRAKPVESSVQVDWYCWRATKSMIKRVLVNRVITPVIIVISWFWLVGAVILTKLPDYTNYVLRAHASVFAVFLALFSIGIALGSLIINVILSGKSSLRFVPHAMVCMSFFMVDLYWVTPNYPIDLTLASITQFFISWVHWRIAIDIFLLAFCAGVFVVPLYSYLQLISDVAIRSQTIAANNIINAFFIVVGMGLVSTLLYFQVVIAQIFLIIGILNGVMVVLWVLLYKNLRYLLMD